MSFLLDTNIFITAKNELPIDVYPSFWRTLSELASAGLFKSIKKVENEIRKGQDDLVDWIDGNLPDDFFIKEDTGTLASLGVMTQWVMANGVYTSAAKEEFASVADSWIIAEALFRSVTVVTYETPDPLCRRRVKIPDVCNAVGVRYCNLNDAFRALGVKI